MRGISHALLLAFAITNAIVYSALLPLWEGFDEAFHYGYVDSLASTRKAPVLGETRLPNEVWDSLLRTPVSHVVQHAWPELQSFDQYFALTAAEQARQIGARDGLPHDVTGSVHTNYEAQQPPLAYAILAVPDLILWKARLASRILWLRIFASVIALCITYFGGRSLLSPLAMFCIFACQMYWATVSHIGNDWLALALSVWFFAAVCRFANDPAPRFAIHLAIVTALGLLTKAYFLPLAAVAAVEVAWLRRRSLPVFVAIIGLCAGPWYVRNLVLYGNVSGLLMTRNGVRVSNIGSVDWSRAIPYMLRATLWTGNNSFLNFSQFTLDAVLALLACGLVLYARSVRKADLWLITSIAIYGCAIVWVTANDVEFLHGQSAGAAPWYTVVLLAPVVALSFTGMSRGGRPGSILAAATATLFLYICAATYAVKLIPLYSGFPEGRNTLLKTLQWYGSGASWGGTLSRTSLAPWYAICAGAGMIVLLGTVVLITVLRSGCPQWRAKTHRPYP